jgi:tripartite-type tricarboxylate transporter receptor subunit TctC
MKLQIAKGAIRSFLAVILTFLVVTPAGAADVSFPTKSIRLLVGYSPGSGADLAARFVANKLQDSLKQPVVVENKPGAGGLIAAQEVARAPADGHTLLLGAMPQMIIAPGLAATAPYDVLRDFEPVIELVSSDMILTTNPSRVPATDLEGFVRWTRAQGRVFMGTPGKGTVAHLGSLMLADKTRLKVDIVHYKVTGDSIVGLMNGDIQAGFLSLGVAAPQVKAGKLRALANASSIRSTLLPEVPTFKEAGYAGLDFTTWYGIFAPARTPSHVLAKLGEESVRAVQSGDSRSKLEAAGLTVTGKSRGEFSRQIKEEKARWSKTIEASKLDAKD